MAIDNDKKDLDGLAAEYVLGTLSVDEKTTCRRTPFRR